MRIPSHGTGATCRARKQEKRTGRWRVPRRAQPALSRRARPSRSPWDSPRMPRVCIRDESIRNSQLRRYTSWAASSPPSGSHEPTTDRSPIGTPAKVRKDRGGFFNRNEKHSRSEDRLCREALREPHSCSEVAASMSRESGSSTGWQEPSQGTAVTRMVSWCPVWRPAR